MLHSITNVPFNFPGWGCITTFYPIQKPGIGLCTKLSPVLIHCFQFSPLHSRLFHIHPTPSFLPLFPPFQLLVWDRILALNLRLLVIVFE